MAKRDRFFAGFGAALFLVTSSALTVAVIISLSHSNAPANTSSNSTAAKSNSNSIAALDFKKGTTLPSQLYKPGSQHPSNLQYIDVVKGTGPVVQAGATIQADYVGFLLSNGTVFDDSTADGGAATFPLTQVIAGWTEGIPGMRVGGTRELLIPSALGYGKQGNAGIPANADLGFFVQVDAIK